MQTRQIKIGNINEKAEFVNMVLPNLIQAAGRNYSVSTDSFCLNIEIGLKALWSIRQNFVEKDCV